MNKPLILTLTDHNDLRLRSIDDNDIEDLRNWKNKNKDSFFLNKEITEEQQQKWFASFSSKENDHMFIVEQKESREWVKIGCMGFRKLEEEGCVDAYNIIRSHRIDSATFSMSDAFRVMLAYANSLYPNLPIQVKVLAHNPAVMWYQVNKFTVLKQVENYVIMQLNLNLTKKTKINKIELA